MIEPFFQIPVFGEIIFESLKWIMLFGGIVSLFMGGIMFQNPEVIRSMNVRLNKWVSERKSMKPLEIMRDMDGYFYRYNKAVGWVMIVLSVYCLYVLISKFSSSALWDIYAPSNRVEYAANILIDTMRWVFVIFIFVFLPVWFLLIFSPDKVKKISRYFNRWLSTRLLLLPLEKMHTEFDTLVLNNHRLFGTVFVLVALLIFYTFLIAV